MDGCSDLNHGIRKLEIQGEKMSADVTNSLKDGFDLKKGIGQK